MSTYFQPSRDGSELKKNFKSVFYIIRIWFDSDAGDCHDGGQGHCESSITDVVRPKTDLCFSKKKESQYSKTLKNEEASEFKFLTTSQRRDAWPFFLSVPLASSPHAPFRPSFKFKNLNPQQKTDGPISIQKNETPENSNFQGF